MRAELTGSDDYYKAQADRLAQKDLRATPMASTPKMELRGVCAFSEHD